MFHYLLSQDDLLKLGRFDFKFGIFLLVFENLSFQSVMDYVQSPQVSEDRVDLSLFR